MLARLLYPFVVMALLVALDTAAAQNGTTGGTAPAATASAGSSAFCLYELPADEDKRRWVNLGIVQYLEYSRNELHIFYGGGNLGAGHEARIAISSPTQLQETLDRLKQTAANCR